MNMDSQVLIQTSGSIHVSEERSERTVKKSHSRKKSMKKNKDDGSVSVSRSSSKLFKKMRDDPSDANPACEKCSRPVYLVERVKAERKTWHKECFRCTECNKQLTVETYQSNHTNLYCKLHFKNLFSPKAVENGDETDATPRRHQMIICESNPVELPPDVVRASDKPDLGLEELSQLDVKSRFQAFERRGRQQQAPPPEPLARPEPSAALLSKLAKFKSKGMDIGVSDEYLNGIPIEPSSSEGEEDEDSVLKRSYKHTALKEQPVSFCNMNEIVGRFENGELDSNERRQERKQEIQNIRSRLFMGKQAKIKEMYEQSVMQSEQTLTSAEKIAKALEVDGEKARSIKHKFETGEIYGDENLPPKNRDIEDEALFNEVDGGKARNIKQKFETGEIYANEKLAENRNVGGTAFYCEGGLQENARTIKQKFETGAVYDEKAALKNRNIENEALFNEGIGKKSRSIFLELDANAKNLGPASPPPRENEPPKRKEKPFVPKDVVRADDKMEDVRIETSDITSKFKFFETYQPKEVRKEFRMTPPRQDELKERESPEIYREPLVARNEPTVAADTNLAEQRHTASRMINVFKQMEEQQGRGDHDNHGPKPLKSFTPPPPGADYRAPSSSDEYSDSEGEQDSEDSEDERRRQYLAAREADEALQQAQTLARTKSFRDKFENWKQNEPQRSPSQAVLEREPSGEDNDSQIETAKSLRAKFESMRVQQNNVAKAVGAPKVNRFV